MLREEVEFYIKTLEDYLIDINYYIQEDVAKVQTLKVLGKEITDLLELHKGYTENLLKNLYLMLEMYNNNTANTLEFEELYQSLKEDVGECFKNSTESLKKHLLTKTTLH